MPEWIWVAEMGLAIAFTIGYSVWSFLHLNSDKPQGSTRPDVQGS